MGMLITGTSQILDTIIVVECVCVCVGGGGEGGVGFISVLALRVIT